MKERWSPIQYAAAPRRRPSTQDHPSLSLPPPLPEVVVPSRWARGQTEEARREEQGSRLVTSLKDFASIRNSFDLSPPPRLGGLGRYPISPGEALRFTTGCCARVGGGGVERPPLSGRLLRTRLLRGCQDQTLTRGIGCAAPIAFPGVTSCAPESAHTPMSCWRCAEVSRARWVTTVW